MQSTGFDRDKLRIKKLAERRNRIFIENDHVPLSWKPEGLTQSQKDLIRKTSERIRTARKNNRSVILAFGAHSIKNGLAPVLIAMIREGWVTHLATNGAGIIHDWEIAYQGMTSEDVRENVSKGEFGIWEETGLYINLALLTGAWEGLGYGESVGKMIAQEGLTIPDPEFLVKESRRLTGTDPPGAAAALDLYGAINKFNIAPGFMSIPHPFRQYSAQYQAFELKVPFTGHPMIGHDIIYTHPANSGAATGRTALADFLCFAGSVSNIGNGVYLSVGSAIMSPMIFEKALSMAQNIEIQRNSHVDNHYIVAVDLARSDWNWSQDGEPSADNPAYYLRYFKTFSRMGGEAHYLSASNKEFLHELYHMLSEQ